MSKKKEAFEILKKVLKNTRKSEVPFECVVFGSIGITVAMIDVKILIPVDLNIFGTAEYRVDIDWVKQAVAKAKKNEIDFVFNDNEVSLTFGKYSLSSRVLPVKADYPEFERLKGSVLEIISMGDKLIDGRKVVPASYSELFSVDKFKTATRFAGNDDLRPIMSGVYYDKTGVCATDAHRMYFEDFENDLKESVVIPRYVFKYFDSDFRVRFCEKEIEILFEGFFVTFLKEDGKYPNYRNVIPEQFNYETSTNRKELIETVDVALSQANKTTRKLEFNFNFGKVTSEDLDFNKKFEGEVEFSEKMDITIGFNGRFLLEIIKGLKREDVNFKMNEPHKAVILNDHYLLMPVMTR